MKFVLSHTLNEPRNNCLVTIHGDWRDVECPCGSTFHFFDGKIDDLFKWERIHLRHMTTDYANHDMLSFYPIDMVIFYHSKTGYTVERRRHKIDDISNIYQAAIYDTAKLAGV